MKKYNLITNLTITFSKFSDAEIREMRDSAMAFSEPMNLRSPLRGSLRMFILDAEFELNQRRDWREGLTAGDPLAMDAKFYGPQTEPTNP